jgi:hypothetical protein
MNSHDSSSSDDDSVSSSDTIREKQIRGAEIYRPAKEINEVTSRIIKMRLCDDAEFMDHIVECDYIFETMKEFKEKARDHTYGKKEDPKDTAMKQIIASAFSKRADLCCEYEIITREGDWSVSFLQQIEGEVRRFMLILEPFALTNEEIEADWRLRGTIFGKITTTYDKVVMAREVIYGRLLEAEDQAEVPEVKLARLGVAIPLFLLKVSTVTVDFLWVYCYIMIEWLKGAFILKR